MTSQSTPTEIRALVQAAREQHIPPAAYVTANRLGAYDREPQLLEIIEGLLADSERQEVEIEALSQYVEGYLAGRAHMETGGI